MTQMLNDTKSVLDFADQKMNKALDAIRHEFQSLRTGRASVALVENIHVDCYNASMPLKGVASITTPDAKTISIQPWDQSVTGAIEKAILASNLGLTPNNDGHSIRIQVPALTQERRAELDRLIRKVAEEGRVSVRATRQEANEAIKKLEKAKTVSEDLSRTTQKKIQELTDKFVHLIDEALAKKEGEIQGV